MARVYRDAVALSVGEAVFKGYQDVVNQVGSKDMMPTLDNAMRRLGKVQRWYFLEWSAADDGCGFAITKDYAYRHEEGVEGMIDHVSRLVDSDPVPTLLRSLAPDTAGVALSVTPADIGDRLYRTRYMEECGISQRLSLVHRSRDLWWVMNLSRSASDGELAEHDIAQFGAFSLLVFPLLERHQHIMAREREAPSIQLEDIERLIRQRFSDLTPRETQVCARSIFGFSSKSIARDLAIGVESVVTYRKRVYGRTGFNCIEQLARSILN